MRRRAGRCFVAANDATKTREAADDLSGDGHLYFALDISREEECGKLAEFIRSRELAVQTLVNSAGVSIPRCVLAPDLEEWRRPIDVMLHGAVYLCRHVVPEMRTAAGSSTSRRSTMSG